MKIYLFDPETGLYLGEDFIDDVPVKGGSVTMPPDATTVVPPRWERGQVPVFNSSEQRWEIYDISALPRSLSNKTEENSPSEESQ